MIQFKLRNATSLRALIDRRPKFSKRNDVTGEVLGHGCPALEGRKLSNYYVVSVNIQTQIAKFKLRNARSLPRTHVLSSIADPNSPIATV